MKPDRTCDARLDWSTQHPWLYIYAVISADLLLLLGFGWLIESLKGALP